MSSNLYKRLATLLPDAPVLVGRVIEHHDDDTSTVELPVELPLVNLGGVARGSLIRPRGRDVPVGGWAFVRRNVIETQAPNWTISDVSLIGAPPPPPAPPPPSPPGGGTWSMPAVGPDGASVTAVADGNTVEMRNNFLSATVFAEQGRSTGKRYFEFGCDAITRHILAYGIVIGRSDSELLTDIYGTESTDRWIFIYSETQPRRIGGEAVWIDNTITTSTYKLNSDLAWTPEPRVSGNVLGFAVDLDAGRLDKFFINGVEFGFDPEDAATFNTVNSWVGGTMVRPAISGRGGDDPDFPNVTSLHLQTFTYPIPAGYVGWMS